jgi:Xaa-Pro aminopeptidase
MDDECGAAPDDAVRLSRLRLRFDGVVEQARKVKRPEAVALHREAARITDFMLTAGFEMVSDGVHRGTSLPTEAELARAVSRAGAATMYEEHADVVVVPNLAGGLVYFGANSARPHALPSGTRLRCGDTFMLSLGAAVGGRHVEGELTFVLDEPTNEQAAYYDAVLTSHLAGLHGLSAGRRCGDVNAECLAVIREAGFGKYLRHRQGHGTGMNIHEPPWLEDGDQPTLLSGMIASNEPGVHVPGHGGYRISDSVLITADGGELLTNFPKALKDVVIDV